MPTLHRRLLALLAAALLCSGAHAQLKGSYVLDSARHKLDLYYVDEQHMRASFDDEHQIVMKGKEVWVLKRQGGTEWLAVPADQVGALLKAAKGKHRIPELQPVTLKATERRETVAGFPGRVFEAQSGERSGNVTLSDNPQVLALTNGWRKLALKLSEYLGAEQSAQLQQVLNTLPTSGFGGLLRQDDQLALVALDTKVKPADADFPPNTRMLELPKFQLPDFN